MARTPTCKVLLVDQDAGRKQLRAVLERDEFSVVGATRLDEALAVLRKGFEPDAIVFGVCGSDPVDTLAAIRGVRPQLAVVVLRESGVPMPACDERSRSLERHESVARIGDTVRELVAPASNRPPAGSERLIVGSPAMVAVRQLIRQVADTDVPVLITGDSGVGKEVVARTLHEDSSRSQAPFIKVNCAALPDQLLESELFGYERGAFTGADRTRPGKFELAHGGTIFLDEIGEISGGTQAKLLQVLQDGCYYRLGGTREIRVDARVVSSTNRHLEEAIAEGSFRKDLFFRLNVVRIEVPRLRDRRQEVPLLAEHFLQRYEREYGRHVGPLDEDAVRALVRHDWPGNVRELENIVRRMVVLQSVEAGLSALTPGIGGSDGRGFDLDALVGPDGELPPLKETSKLAALEVEGELIRRALERTHWNRRQAARLLEISYKALLYKIRDCGITAA